MRFSPSYTLDIIKEEDFNSEILQVEQVIQEYKNFGKFDAFDKTKIYYEYYLVEKPKANVVIVHGLSEFIRKFDEFIYYLMNQGYNVFIYDQRCHGMSGRLTKSQHLLHVDNFRDYAADLEQFIEEVVIPTENIPIYLYSHSMGGAVCTLYLAEHSDRVEKAVFSAPLFEPIVNSVPVPLARVSVRLGRIFLGSKKRFFLSNDFDPEIKYKESYGSSEARFYYNIKLRKENEKHQSSPMSFGWVDNSLRIRRRLLKDRLIKGIKTPILLFSAENDRAVNNLPQREFADKCKTCRLIEVKGATHALLASESGELEKLIKLTLDFYAN